MNRDLTNLGREHLEPGLFTQGFTAEQVLVARSAMPASSAPLEADWDSVGMFSAASASRARTEGDVERPWGGPGAPVWQRLAAAIVRTGEIRIGRFPK